MEPTTPTHSARNRWWLLLLAAPYVGLLIPQIYSRTTPEWLGFPFFYWYQFLWTVVMAPLTWLVYVRTKVRTKTPGTKRQGSK